MKRTISLIVAFAFALCVTALAPRVSSAQGSLAKLVPQDAVFFKQSVDFEKLWANVTASNFWKRVTGLRVWDDTGARAGIEDFAEEFSENMGFELSTKNIMSLLGKEVATAVCVETGEAPKIRGYVLFRGNPKSVAEDIVNKSWKVINEQISESGDAEVEVTPHKGTRITRIKSTEVPVQVEFGFIDDVFALGVANASPQLAKIVDLAGGTGASLADNANFKKILAASKITTGQYAGCFYADLQKVGEIFAAIDETALPMPMQAAVMSMKQSFSMPIVIGGIGHIDRGELIRLVSLPVGEVSDKLLRLSYGTPPAAGKNISYVPQNTIGYVAANNSPDWEAMYPLLLEQWQKQGVMPAMNMIIGQIETALGIKIAEDVIPWIGNEVALLFTDVDTKPGFPYPKFAFMLKIKDNAKASAFVTKLSSVLKEFVEETGFKFEKSVYQGCTFNCVTIVLPMPMPITLTPSYGIAEDFLIVASSDDLLKQMIDTSKGTGKDLASNPAFKALDMPAKSNSTAFFNWAQFMEVVKAVGAWGVQFSEAQPIAESVKSAVEGYVVPIANCLAALQTVGLYQLNQENMSTATYILRVKDLPPR